MNHSLANFTDVLDDEICDSQPLSLTSSNDSNIVREVNNKANSLGTLVTNCPARGTGQRGHFRSIEEIDPKYREVFSYPYFNLVQSRVIDDALYTDKSIVVCAPTGSGKTVVFEMAIVQLLMDLEDKNYNEDFKIIYMAPVKALCTERLTEWYPKLTKLGLLCIEATGDTDVDFSQLKPYKVIITTPEKWDMLTRRWRDHKNLVEVIKLFLIDEVHILNDETRGPVLEAVVSRMKTIESSAQSVHRIEQLQGSELTHKTAPSIRFVAVSATVSNPEDVANWLGTANKPAVFHKFGDECRPVKLKRVVEGYHCPESTSIFKFDIILNYKLWPVIQKYHSGKPTLIFCNTRKSVALTAEVLSKELTINFSPEQKAKLTAVASSIKNKKLQALVMSGVGCHHAGLLYEERQNIEQAFRNRDLPILITTTTLAMGVNLPAHLVIIKNTQQYVNGGYQEYSISTVLQMVGRAGRPQFDTEATAVIMTRLADKARYQALVGGCEPLQSYLHKRLPENLNSEAALGTVGDVAQCVEWLRSTFLYVRAARDPKKYLGLPQNSPQHQISKKIEELCVKAMNGLASAGLITMDEASCIASTEAGRLMSIFYLDLETMKLLMKIQGTETLEQLLVLICESHELSDMHLRVDERRCLNALNRNNTAATIRFPMKGRINTRQMKLNCVIQAVLGCLVIPDPSLNQEAMKIMRIADRVCKCLVAFVTRPDLISRQPQFYSAVLNSVILAKCLAAHLWENSPFVSKQLKGIGPTFSTLLATAGKVNFILLEESHPRDLERIMNKSAPAGNILRKQITLLPKYQLSMIPVDENTVNVQLLLLNQHFLAENLEQLTAGEAHKSYIIVGDSNNHLLLLASFKDKDLIGVFNGTITHEIRRKHIRGHKIFVHCISTTIVGIDVQSEYVFNDLNKYVGPSSINYDQIEKPMKDTPKKQTCITDTFKERKRKGSSDLDKAQSKEKKKRENAIIENFKYLKKTFDIASKNIKESIKPQYQIDEVNLHNNIKSFNVEDEIDSDDFIDNEKVDSILTEIEHEMLKNHANTTKPCLLNDKKDQIQKCNAWPLSTLEKEVVTKPYLPNKLNNFKTEINKRKPLKQKSNYNFIELLEKNIDLSDDEDKIVVSNTNNGFSEAIKSQINKYIQTAGNKSDTTDSNIQLLLENERNMTLHSNDKQDTSVVCSEKDLPPLQHFYPRYEIKEILTDQNSKENIKTTTSEIKSPKKVLSKLEVNKENAVLPNNNETVCSSYKLYPNYEIKEILYDQNSLRTNSFSKRAADIDNSDVSINPKKLDELSKSESKKHNALYASSAENLSSTQKLHTNYEINNAAKTFNQTDQPRTHHLNCNVASQNNAVDSQKTLSHLLTLTSINGNRNKNSTIFDKYKINKNCLIQSNEENNIDNFGCIILSPNKTNKPSKPESSQENLVTSEDKKGLYPTDKLYTHYKTDDESLDHKTITRNSVEVNTDNSDCMTVNLKSIVDYTNTSTYDPEPKMPVQNVCVQQSSNEINLDNINTKADKAQNQHSEVNRMSSDIPIKTNNSLTLHNNLYNSKSDITDTEHNKQCCMKPQSDDLFDFSNKLDSIEPVLVPSQNTDVYKYWQSNRSHSTNVSLNVNIKDKLNDNYQYPIPFVVKEDSQKPKQATNENCIIKDIDVENDSTLNNSRDLCKNTSTLINKPDTNINNQFRSSEIIRHNLSNSYYTKTNYCNNYTYSTTKKCVFTEQNPEYSVRVVKKIKMDLNITEIISTEKIPTDETSKLNHAPNPTHIVVNDEDREITVNKGNLVCINRDAVQYNKNSEKECFQQPASNKLHVPSLPHIEYPKIEINNTLTTEQNIIPLVQYKHDDLKNTADVNTVNLKNDYSQDVNNCEQVDKIHEQKNKHNKLQNILHKYSRIIGKDQAPNQNTLHIPTIRNIECAKPSTLKSLSKKPFKISDIEKLRAPLPETLIDSNIAPVNLNLPMCITETNDEEKFLKDLEPISYASCYNVSPIFENVCQKESIPDLKPILDIDLETNDDYNLDQSMFDPKTLLQCTVSEDIYSEEIIPPPIQFCDYVRKPSSQDYTETNTSFNNYSLCEALGTNTSAEKYLNDCNESIFEDNCTPNLTPSREIETWTLDTEDFLEDKEDTLLNPIKSFTVIRRKTSKFRVPYITGNGLITRKAKLGQFKFNHKNKLRK